MISLYKYLAVLAAERLGWLNSVDEAEVQKLFDQRPDLQFMQVDGRRAVGFALGLVLFVSISCFSTQLALSFSGPIIMVLLGRVAVSALQMVLHRYLPRLRKTSSLARDAFAEARRGDTKRLEVLERSNLGAALLRDERPHRENGLGSKRITPPN